MPRLPKSRSIAWSRRCMRARPSSPPRSRRSRCPSPAQSRRRSPRSRITRARSSSTRRRDCGRRKNEARASRMSAHKLAEHAGDTLLAVLADRGIEYLFGNAGTDFPSVIEAFAKASLEGRRVPVPVTVPHENVAVAMAHGYYLATGRPQAVMVHVNVGTANAICGLINATRENIPILLLAGRTPITEEGRVGGRSVYIHWGQEMFDQAG